MIAARPATMLVPGSSSTTSRSNHEAWASSCPASPQPSCDAVLALGATRTGAAEPACRATEDAAGSAPHRERAPGSVPRLARRSQAARRRRPAGGPRRSLRAFRTGCRTPLPTRAARRRRPCARTTADRRRRSRCLRPRSRGVGGVVALVTSRAPPGPGIAPPGPRCLLPTPEGPAITNRMPRRAAKAGGLLRELGQQQLALLGAQSTDTTGGADVELFHDLAGANLADAGQDSSTTDTFILPTVSSSRLSTCCSESFPDFSSPFSSARASARRRPSRGPERAAPGSTAAAPSPAPSCRVRR